MNKNDTLLSESNFFYFLFVGHCLASLKATQNRECRKYLVKIIEKDIYFFFGEIESLQEKFGFVG